MHTLLAARSFMVNVTEFSYNAGRTPQVRSRAPSPGLSINQEVAEADLGVGLRTRGPPYENSATLPLWSRFGIGGIRTGFPKSSRVRTATVSERAANKTCL